MPDRDRFVAKINMQGVIIDETTGKEIGLDMAAVGAIRKDLDDLSQKASKYLEELYESGTRQRPKTVEQISQEQSQINARLLEKLDKIDNRLNAIENSGKGVFKI